VRTAYIEIGPASRSNQLPGTVRRRMFHGDFVQYVVDCPIGQIIVRRPPTNLVAEGQAIRLSFSPEHSNLL
jgi:iron(III) transport system ATP-binding protein